MSDEIDRLAIAAGLLNDYGGREIASASRLSLFADLLLAEERKRSEKARDALAVVVADWTQQFERNGRLAPRWVRQAREALGVYESPLKRLDEPAQPTRHQQREAWRTGENGL